MKQIHNILNIAALVLAGALTTGCVDQLNDPQQPLEGEKIVTLTTTIGLDTSTKALNPSTGSKTFAEGDMIAVIYRNTSGNTVKAVTDGLDAGAIHGGGKHADITVTLYNPVAGTVSYVYPASMVVNDATLAPLATDAAGIINTAALAAQDGRLATLAANLDCGVGSGTMTEDAGTFTLPGGVTLSNQFAILELTAKIFAGSATLDALTSLTVGDGTNTYTVTPASPASLLSWPIYVAVLPVTDDKTITFTATESDLYSYTKIITSQALVKNNIYPCNVKMHRNVKLAELAGPFSALHGDVLQGILGGYYKISITDGAAVTLDNATINGEDNTSYPWAGLTCEGDATIILADGTENTVKGCDKRYPGILVPAGHKLIIQGGTGKLSALAQYEEYYSSYGGAGIGGAYDSDCGDIEIQGGIIIAQGGHRGAGIGGSGGGNSIEITHLCGAITISGGNVTASGGPSAAGIGGSENGTTGTITISGGTVKAYGGSSAAGIGSGGDTYEGSRNSNCGNILIEGTASVEAHAGPRGAGIGSGWQAGCGSITIKGSANVTAYGGDAAWGGAGIGSGVGSLGQGCGAISISTSGTVTAMGGKDGAGIGCGGSANARYGGCGDITISAGTIIATGGDYGAGIGLTGGASACGSITITSGVTKVTATKGCNANHSIGRGSGSYFDTTQLGTITIGGTVYWDGSDFKNEGNTYLSTSPLEYQP